MLPPLRETLVTTERLVLAPDASGALGTCLAKRCAQQGGLEPAPEGLAQQLA